MLVPRIAHESLVIDVSYGYLLWNCARTIGFSVLAETTALEV